MILKENCLIRVKNQVEALEVLGKLKNLGFDTETRSEWNLDITNKMDNICIRKWSIFIYMDCEVSIHCHDVGIKDENKFQTFEEFKQNLERLKIK